MITRRNALATAALAPALAHAQPAAAWRPSRPIRLIVPFAPGGSNDIVGRLIAEPAGATLGQPVVIENRAGAGGMIGAEAAARSAPDGYTLLINSAQSAIPAVTARVPYDTIADFVGIAVAGFSPHVVVVNPRVPAQNFAELVAFLRANPGRINLASAGPGSGVHLAGEIFRGNTQTQVELVHYRGGGPSVAALVAGEAQVGTPTMASSLGQVRGGGIRALAVMAAERTPVLPNVPSATEVGFPGMVFEEFFPVLAPAGTPPAAVAALGAAFQGAIRQQADRLAELAGVRPRAGYETPEQVMALVREMAQSYASVVRAAGVQPE